ncbi:MAG: phosphoglucosamine mutase, partial [Candidatus Hadarchaeum sp.]|nr:phosphoglucosamine mutase [Candidatus Hadarchaeum sp.]
HDALLALFAKRTIESKKGGIAITSINTSVAIDEVVTKAGGSTIRTALGNIHAAMQEHDAVFAGEPGKIIFLDFGPWIDGVLAAAKLLEIMSMEGKLISKIIAADVPDYPFYHEDFACSDEKKAAFMQGIRDYLPKNVSEVRDLLEVDGLRVNRNNGSWILIRVSGTEPKGRIVVEGRTQAEMEELKIIGLRGIKEFLK